MEEAKNTNKTISDSSRTGIKTIEVAAKGIDVVNRKIGNRLSTRTDAIDNGLKSKFENKSNEVLVKGTDVVNQRHSNQLPTSTGAVENELKSKFENRDEELTNKSGQSGGLKTGVAKGQFQLANSNASTIRTKTNNTNWSPSDQRSTVGSNNAVRTGTTQGMQGSDTNDNQIIETIMPVDRGKTSKAISRVMKATVLGAKVARKFVGATKLLDQTTEGNSNQATMDVIERKIKKTVIKTSTKVVAKPTKYLVKKIARKPMRYLKKKTATFINKILLLVKKIAKSIVSKLIMATGTFIIGCGAVIVPCAAGIAVLVMVFGGGSGQEIMDKYESYILAVNEEYRYEADYIRKIHPNVHTDSFDGTYGRIDWRAFLSIVQGLRGELDFGMDEVTLLDKFQNAGLYERQKVITEGENYILRITNSSLSEYESFINELFITDNEYMCRLTGRAQEQITDDQKELIDTLYSSEDLFSMFSPALQQFATVIDPSTGNSLSGVVVTGNSELGNAIAKKALTKTGYRYWWGAPGGGFGDKQKLDDPNAAYFDCSGFVAWSHRQSGVKINRTTAAGYSKSGLEVQYGELQAGDVITFSYDRGRTVAHIGIYIGGGKMVHAAGDGSTTTGQYANQCVMVSPITVDSYYYQYIFNCRRLY